MGAFFADIRPRGRSFIAKTHGHHKGQTTRTARLRIALSLTFIYMIAEAVGGWLTNSLALMADCGHMLTDVGALTLTLAAIWFGARPATAKKTFGYYRFEILAAFVNGIVLVLLALAVIYAAVARWSAPPVVDGARMMAIAAGGLVVNIVSAKLLHSKREEDLNMNGAWLHIIGDLLGSITAVAAGALIIGFAWYWADPLCSILISVIIIYGAWRLIVESVNILLEGTPAHISLASVKQAILATDGVAGVHDLHVWTISSGMEALSAHISHGDSVVHSVLLARVREKLHERFGIKHLTIQMETMEHEAEAVYVCETGARCFEPTKSL